MRFALCLAWHNEEQLRMFFEAWSVDPCELPPWICLERDVSREGGAKTKNKAIRRAIAQGAEAIIVLDDDCYPEESESYEGSLETFCEQHLACLAEQSVEMFAVVTNPPSRGTPYFNRTITMPVAASMGFWTNVGDYDAPSQLVHGQQHPMQFFRGTIHGRFFPLCGMNYAFRSHWLPWCLHVENVGRMDDIWMGFLWQRRAYATGHCFNLCGPLIRHVRQSNVWANLRDEALRLEANETIWKAIHSEPSLDYSTLHSLLFK